MPMSWLTLKGVYFTSLGDQTISQLECIHPASISFPQWGRSMSLLPKEKQNAPCLSQETKCKHSAVPLSVVCPLREQTALRPPSRADAVTGIDRPNLLASSFSRRLQGDFGFPSLSALHQNSGSLCSGEKVTRPHLRQTIRFPNHIIIFSPFVKALACYFGFAGIQYGRDRGRRRFDP